MRQDWIFIVVAPLSCIADWIFIANHLNNNKSPNNREKRIFFIQRMIEAYVYLPLVTVAIVYLWQPAELMAFFIKNTLRLPTGHFQEQKQRPVHIQIYIHRERRDHRTTGMNTSRYTTWSYDLDRALITKKNYQP